MAPTIFQTLARELTQELIEEVLREALRSNVAARVISETIRRGGELPPPNRAATILAQEGLGLPANKIARAIGAGNRIRGRSTELEQAGDTAMARQIRRSSRALVRQQLQDLNEIPRISDIPIRSGEVAGEAGSRTRFRYFFRTEQELPSGVRVVRHIPFDTEQRLSRVEASAQLRDFLEARYPGFRVLSSPEFRGVVRRY